ncbi:MAG: DNA polymerase IV, partial [Pseudomonadales bacterium]
MSEGQQRKIIHIDCDSFFASVEMRDDPSLRGRPVAVGGSPDGRGVVATCSYEARRFGVRSAMPMAQALRLCPELVVLRTRMDKYKEASEAVQSIFRRFTDRIEPLSLDEAFLDVTGSVLFNGSATRIAEAIRRAVREELGLTVSAGVAPNKFLAKIASDWRKPDGLFVLKPDEVDAFVRRLPVEKLFGVGPRTAEKLHRLGLRSCEDLRTLDLPTLTERFGVFGKRLFDLARGQDERPVQPHRVRKSLSVERTFSEDLATEAACLALFP